MMRTLTLAEILAGCDRAAMRVALWPEWKRALGRREQTPAPAPAESACVDGGACGKKEPTCTSF
jgi:hypothetical protein